MVRQAMEERKEMLAARREYVSRSYDTQPTPAQVMHELVDDDDDDDDDDENDDDSDDLAPSASTGSPTGKAAGEVSARLKAEVTVDSLGRDFVNPQDLEKLRARLRSIDTAQAGYMMAGVEAVVRASEKAAAVARGEPVPHYDDRYSLLRLTDRS